MRKILTALSLLWALGPMLSGCGPKTLIDDRQQVSNGTWTYAFKPRFDFEVPDSNRLYNMRLCISHSDRYEWENVYIRLHTFFPNGEKTAYTKNIPLSNASGEWLGSGWGSTKTLTVPLIDSFYFTVPGSYALEVEQFMRKDSLAGISAIGLVVEDCGKDRQK